MAQITIPAPSTRLEVRCSAVIARNNLDVALSDPPTLAELSEKYGRIILDRALEPVDAAGKACGPRQQIDAAELTYAEVAGRVYARPDGTTFTGAQFAWDMQIMADFHKAKGLTAPEKTQGVKP